MRMETIDDVRPTAAAAASVCMTRASRPALPAFEHESLAPLEEFSVESGRKFIF